MDTTTGERQLTILLGLTWSHAGHSAGTSLSKHSKTPVRLTLLNPFPTTVHTHLFGRQSGCDTTTAALATGCTGLVTRGRLTVAVKRGRAMPHGSACSVPPGSGQRRRQLTDTDGQDHITPTHEAHAGRAVDRRITRASCVRSFLRQYNHGLAVLANRFASSRSGETAAPPSVAESMWTRPSTQS